MTKTPEIQTLELDGLHQKRHIKVSLDTGSRETFINADIAKGLEKKRVETQFEITAANGTKQTINEQTEFRFTFIQVPHIEFKINAFVLNGLPTDLNLGSKFLESNHVILDFSKKLIKIDEFEIEIPQPRQEALPTPDLLLTQRVLQVNDHQKKLTTLLNNYKENLDQYGLIPNAEHTIYLKRGCIVSSKPYQSPISLTQEFNEELRRLKDLNFIRDSKSCFGSPCFAICKGNGELRLVIDYRKLNSFTLQDPFHLPRIEDMFLELKSSCIYTRLDMKNGYHQLAMRNEAISKTAFVSQRGHFEFLQMPFGLATAPRTFQRAISNIFKPDHNVLVFLDDLLIHNKNLEEHMKTLKLVFEKLKKHNILLNLSKCEFFLSKIRYLGSIVSHDKITADLEKLKTKNKAPPPKNQRELRRFLGFANWFRPFVPESLNSLQTSTTNLKRRVFPGNLKTKIKGKMFLKLLLLASQ